MKVFFILVLYFIVNWNILSGQEPRFNDQSLELKIRIPELASNTLNIGIEYIPNKQFSTGINTGVQVSSEPNLALGLNSDVDFYTIIEGKYFFIPKYGADKLYFSPFGLYEYDESIAPIDQVRFENRVTFGGMLGYKLLYKSNFLIDFSIGTGIGKSFIKIENDFGDTISTYKEVFRFPLIMVLGVGYRFNLRTI